MDGIRKVEGWAFIVLGAALATFGIGFMSEPNVWMLGVGALMILLGVITLERAR